MAALIGERVGIKNAGTKVTVPGSPTAKLMYYLDCVAVVIRLDDPNLNRLRNYMGYHLLNDTEIDALLALALLLSPDQLIGKVFFPSEDCGESRNKFIELSAVTHMLAVSNNVLIGGERKRVAKIMFFKRCWLEDNYISPLRAFEGRLQRLARGLPRAERSRLRPEHCHPRDLTLHHPDLTLLLVHAPAIVIFCSEMNLMSDCNLSGND